MSDTARAQLYGAKPQWFEARMAAMSAACFFITGLQLPYFPVWLESLRMTPSEIATIVAAPSLVRIVSAPLILALADRGGERAFYLVATSVATAATAALYLLADGFYPVLAITILLGIVWAPQIPLAEAIALSGVRRYGVDYARIRVWGSIAFLSASLAGGYLVQRFGTPSVPWLLLAAFTAAAAISLAVPRIGRPRRLAPLPAAIFSRGRSYLSLAFLAFITAVAVIQASHGLAYGFASIYWRSLGISDSIIGLFWATGVVAEVIMFYTFRPLAARMRPVTLLAIGAGFAVLRWLIFPLIGTLPWPVAGFFAAQLLHAFTFGLTFLAMQRMTAEAVEDEEMASAQGVYVVIGNGILALAIYASGPIYEGLGANGFFVMAAIALAGLIMALFLPRHERAADHPQSAASGGETSEPR